MSESLGCSLGWLHIERRRDRLRDAGVEGGGPTRYDERRINLVPGCWAVVPRGRANMISKRRTHAGWLCSGLCVLTAGSESLRSAPYTRAVDNCFRAVTDVWTGRQMSSPARMRSQTSGACLTTRWYFAQASQGHSLDYNGDAWGAGG